MVKGNILDPCHGWGARLIGSMLEDVEHYTGVDASDLQDLGVKDIFENFKEYSNIKDVNLINSPLKKVKLKKEFYDFALTSLILIGKNILVVNNHIQIIQITIFGKMIFMMC